MWLKAVTTLGVTSVITLGAFYWVTQQVTIDLRAATAELRTLSSAYSALSNDLDEHMAASVDANADQLNMLRQQCLILARIARTDAEVACGDRARTYQPRPRSPQSGQAPGRMFDR
jgi:transposase